MWLPSTISAPTITFRNSSRTGVQHAIRILRTTVKPPSMATYSPRSSFSSVNLTFLGTASAQPSSTRNHSSLALRLSSDVWLFDCGEATQHQIQRSGVKMGKINKIFITHTHGDHIFGLLPLLASRLNGAGGAADGAEDPRANIDTDKPPLEIYGPLGTRAYVRNGLTYTHTILGSPYIVHELRSPHDPQGGDFTSLSLHPSESPDGRNIPQVNGVWSDIFKDELASISAAPIRHSVPCLGFVFTEMPIPGKIDPKIYIPHLKRTNTPMSAMRRLQLGEEVKLSDGTTLRGPPRRDGRKIVILGDTFDPSSITSLAMNANILVHEATNAHLPGLDTATKPLDTYETVESRAKSRGHSTPQMAGAFAKRIGARKLILNHFSARYAGGDTDDAGKIMAAIADLAAQEFGGEVLCAKDFMSLDVGLVDE